MLPSRCLSSLIFVVAGLTSLSSQSLLNNRIVNGHWVDIQGNPWAVYLRSTECTTEGNQKCVHYTCGATPITSRHLLTAAHCVRPLAIASRTTFAVVATTDIGHVTFKNLYSVEKWEKYSEYTDYPVLDGDVAVLTLNRPLDFGAGIKKVELPPRGQEVPEGTEGEIAGWGVIDVKGENTTETNRLIKTTLTINNCSNYVAEDPSLQNKFTERTLCAREENTAPCFGDSGSGLIRRQGTKYIIEGIVSFGDYYCNGTKPEGFVKVSNPAIYDFINSFIQRA